MILVAGGTGTLGTLLVRRLAARGDEVRVLTRDEHRAAHLAGPRVQVLVGNVRNPASVAVAVDGVDVVVSAVHGFLGTKGDSPAKVDRDGNASLVEASARAGAALVLTSVVGAAPGSPMELFRMKAAAERHLQGHAHGWTVVRASAFLETWIALMRQTAARSGRPLILGRGENPINFVAAGDVAAVLAEVVRTGAYNGRVLEVGGPQDLTMNRLAEAVQATDGRAASPRHVPRAALAIGALLRGTKPGRLTRAALAMDTGDFTFPGPAHGREPPLTAATTAADLLQKPGR